MDKLIEELKLKMTIDTSSLDSDGKKFSNKLNNAIKEVVATADKLKRSFDLMTPQDVKKFEDGINKIAKRIRIAEQEFKKGNLSSSIVGDIEKESKNINKVMNTYLKSFGTTLSKQNSLYEKKMKADIDIYKKTENTKNEISIANTKHRNKLELLEANLNAAKEITIFKKKLKEEARLEREAEKEKNKKTFSQKVLGAGETLTKYALGSVLASPVFAATQFATGTFSEVFKGAARYSRDMAQIKAITKATDEEMRRFSLSVKEIGINFGYTTTEGTEAILTLSRLGVEAKNLSGVLNSTAAFAVATGSSLEKSGELLVNTMNAFGYAYEKSDYVMNQMTATLNASALDVEKYSTILGYVGAAAKENNITFEETNTMLTLLSKNGLKASTAGTSLREIFGTLTKDGKSLRETLRELSEQNISYADAVELVGKRAANALTILVKNNKALEETSKYIQLNVLDAKAQADLMAQLSLVEQIARAWNGALTSAKEFFGAMLNKDTEEMTREMLVQAKAATARYNQNSEIVQEMNTKNFARAMQLSVQEWLNGLSDSRKKELGLGVENQEKLEENFARAISNYLKNNKLFSEFKGTDEMANEIAKRLASQSRTTRGQAFKEEAMARAREALAEQQRLNSISARDEDSFIQNFLKNYVSQRNAQYYGIGFEIEDIERIKQTGVSDIRLKQVARERYNKAKEEIDRYKSLGDKATEADRLKWKDAEALMKTLDEKWGFKEKKTRGIGKRLSLSFISDLLEPLKVSPDIRAELDKVEVVSERYKSEIAKTTDKDKIKTLVKDYFKEIEDTRNLLLSNNFTEIIESRQNDIEEIKKLLSEFDKQYRSDLLKKYDGKTDSIYYKTELKKYEDKLSVLNQEIRNFDSNEKEVLSKTRESLDRVIGTTVKVNDFFDKAINFEDSEEALAAINNAMNLMKLYSEERAAGNTYKVKSKYKKDIVSALSMFRERNLSSYESRRTELSSRRGELTGNIGLIESGAPLAPDLIADLYMKYGTVDSNQLLSKMKKELQDVEQWMLTNESTFQRGESRALGLEKTLRTQDREDTETINSFFSDKTVEAIGLLVDHYKTVQDEMLQAQRERIEAEIQNERDKADTINQMNGAAAELGLITQQEYAYKKAVLEQELYEKENALMQSQFEEEKKAEIKMAQIKLTQRLAEIALNVLVAESSKGIIGLIGAPATIGAFSALAVAQSTMEIAAINKKEYVPKRYANGGIVYGASHANGGVPFTVNGRGGYEMEGGEFIVKKSEVPRNIGTLRAINNGTFQSSSYYSNSDEISYKLDALIEASSKPIRAYVTSGDLQKNARARIIINNKTQL